ncbi:MAG: ABC transporter ATP-binding protein [Ignavibacteria bacterium]
MNIIEIRNLTKIYPAKTFSKEKILALNDVSFSVKKGDIFGLLGPNGAGKTTLIKILLTIVHPSSGNIKVYDSNLQHSTYKKNIGYLPENHRFPPYMTAEQVLFYFGSLNGLSRKFLRNRIDEVLTLLELTEWRKTKIKKFSKGMLQRLALAQSVINDPELLFLDEPTDGVDPIGRKKIRDILLNMQQHGKTIFLNSHLLSEVEMICNRVAILHKGALIQESTIEDLTTSSRITVYEVKNMSEKVLNELLTKYDVTINTKERFFLNSTDPIKINEVIDFLRSRQVELISISKHKDTLENMFINLIDQS